LISRSIETGLLPAARQLGVGITAYGVLSRGLISGHWTNQTETPQDFRSRLPRFSGDNLDHNLALVEELRRVADAKSVSVAQLAIAWVLSRGTDIVPLVGARRRDRLVEALGSLQINLTQQDLAAIEGAVPAGAAAGTRYDARQMSILDSERA
jgi:aryl-alcohol dehydrogenase-like predicted oxidoreductase